MEQSGTNSTLSALPMMDHIAIKNRDTVALAELISFYFRSFMLNLFIYQIRSLIRRTENNIS